MDCYRATNNKYFDCPALMSDGRSFTDYRSSRQATNSLRSEMNIINSHNLREFLIKNTDKLIQNERQNSIDVHSCGSCERPYNVGTMLPEKYTQTCDKYKCKVELTNKNGIGLGRAYSDNRFDCNIEFNSQQSSCKNNLNNLY